MCTDFKSRFQPCYYEWYFLGTSRMKSIEFDQQIGDRFQTQSTIKSIQYASMLDLMSIKSTQIPNISHPRFSRRQSDLLRPIASLPQIGVPSFDNQIETNFDVIQQASNVPLHLARFRSMPVLMCQTQSRDVKRCTTLELPRFWWL